MFSAVAKIILTSTAIAPVGITYAFMAFSEGQQRAAQVILAVCATLAIMCVLLIEYAKVNLEYSNFKITSVEAADRENTSFLLLYLLPLFTDKFSTLNWAVWVPTLLIFAVLTATGYNYHVNPLVGLLGWHFYKVESTGGVTYVLLTRKQLKSASGDLDVAQLTEYILIDRGGKR